MRDVASTASIESNFPVIFFAAMLPARSADYPRLAKRSRVEAQTVEKPAGSYLKLFKRKDNLLFLPSGVRLRRFPPSCHILS
ncbi:MAG: hypothetical protein Ct9H300mP32_5500 [Verrucomicrobiota bacterium]|nr:MAG: hypothetical protein Ct9H300mP32_5500 [Verrucomicrobiota bacterium]